MSNLSGITLAKHQNSNKLARFRNPTQFHILKFGGKQLRRNLSATILRITTFSIMTLSITTFSIMTLSIMTLSIMTVSIMTFSVTVN